jgi:hypothetical protein
MPSNGSQNVVQFSHVQCLVGWLGHPMLDLQKSHSFLFSFLSGQGRQAGGGT